LNCQRDADQHQHKGNHDSIDAAHHGGGLSSRSQRKKGRPTQAAKFKGDLSGEGRSGRRVRAAIAKSTPRTGDIATRPGHRIGSSPEVSLWHWPSWALLDEGTGRKEKGRLASGPQGDAERKHGAILCGG
jgi:hypothetical protein